MQILLDIANDFAKKLEPGKTKISYLADVMAMDTRMQMILSHLEFKPDQVKHLNLFREGEDERLTRIQGDMEKLRTDPSSLMGYAVSLICKEIYRTAEEDMMLFATDFSFSSVLRFRLSTSIFGKRNDRDKTPEENKTAAKEKMAALEKAGMEIKQGCLTDCDANRRIIEQYCKTKLGAFSVSFKSHNGEIMDAGVICHPHKICLGGTGEKNASPVAAADVLSDIEVYNLKKEVSDLKTAMSFYSFMDDKNSALDLIQNSIYRIEDITGIHRSIWKEQTDRYAEIRSKNHRYYRMEKELQEQAKDHFLQTDGTASSRLQSAYSIFSQALTDLVAGSGTYVDQFLFHEYNIEVKLSHNSVEKAALAGLSLFHDAYGDVYLTYTPENLEILLKKVQEIVPDAEIHDFEMHNVRGVFCLWSVTFFGNRLKTARK